MQKTKELSSLKKFLIVLAIIPFSIIFFIPVAFIASKMHDDKLSSGGAQFSML